MKGTKWISLGCAAAVAAAGVFTASFAGNVSAAEPEKAVQVVGTQKEEKEPEDTAPGIQKVYTVNHSYGDGQKVSAVGFRGRSRGTEVR